MLVTCLFLSAAATLPQIKPDSLKKSRSFKKIRARVIRKIPLPAGYHEGLFWDGSNVWVANGGVPKGANGNVWVIDLAGGTRLREITPVAGFTEGITRLSEDLLFVTDWETMKLYKVRVENGAMVPQDGGVSFAPAHPAGVVWAGSRLFVITWTRGGRTRFDVLEMDAAATVTSKIAIRDIYEPAHMAWDGRNIWITSWFTRLVYKVDIDRLEILGAFVSPVSKTTGIAWDGKNLWLTGTRGDLYQMEVETINTARAQAASGKGGSDMEIKVTSSAFKEGGMIPRKYTCDGDDISPPLEWSGIPAGAKSIALISDDPDAPMGTWAHWVIFNIPPDEKGMDEGISSDKILSGGAGQGINDSRQTGYGGPCPPSGTHRYYFKVYALDATLELKPGATKKDLVAAMEGHVLGQGQLMGRYKR